MGTAPNTSIVLNKTELDYIRRYYAGKSEVIHFALEKLMETKPAPLTVTYEDITPDASAYSSGKWSVPYLFVDGEDRRVWVATEDQGATGQTFRSYHGFIISIPLWDAVDWTIINPNDLTVFLNKDETQQIIRRIFDGSTSEWNGNNHIAIYNDDAQDALVNLEMGISQLSTETWAVWDAEEWYQMVDANDLGITTNTTNEEIEDMAKRETESLLKNASDVSVDHLVLNGAENYLMELRDSLV